MSKFIFGNLRVRKSDISRYQPIDDIRIELYTIHGKLQLLFPNRDVCDEALSIIDNEYESLEDTSIEVYEISEGLL